MPNPSGNYETFSNWLNRQKTLLQQLLHAISPENPYNTAQQHSNLIDLVLSHYTLYYQEKGIAAREDPFLFLNPPWLTSFERTLLWLGDFKPSIIFRLVNSSVTDLTAEQSERIEQLKAVTRREERQLTERMAGIQESLASAPIYSLARRSHRLIDGEISWMEEAVEALKAAMLAILENADVLRRSTAANVVEILSPIQAIRFLAAGVNFQLEIRRWGQQRDWERASTSNGNGVLFWF
ncbi:protein ZW2-like [Euphorbia lathyris]|uniref:protein ZW2-like n=1 Tax=Euphorbia lathyris TaxID=212925 RepID=UPI003313C7F6